MIGRSRRLRPTLIFLFGYWNTTPNGGGELKIHLENLVLGLALDYEAEFKIQEVETYEIDEEKLSN